MLVKMKVSVHRLLRWSSSASLDGRERGCQSGNITPRGRRQTNWVTKTISSSFNSPCAETLIREFTSNAFSQGQVHNLYLIYLTCCKYCWSFTVDLVRPHFCEVPPRIKLLKTPAMWRPSGVMQILDTVSSPQFLPWSLIILDLLRLLCVDLNYHSLHFELSCVAKSGAASPEV